jgi:hypothetical protein
MKIFYTTKDEELLHDQTYTIAASKEKAMVLAEQNKVLQVQLDFMRLRVNQLEMERAALMQQVTGVNVPVPQIVSTVTQPSPQDMASAMSAHFQDVGDDEAKRQGLMIDPSNGELVYAT